MMEELQSQRALLENLNHQRLTQTGMSTAANPEMPKHVSKAKMSTGAKSSLAQTGSAGSRKQTTLTSCHDPSGSTVLRLVPEPLPVADSGDAGLCALRPDASEPIGSPARDRRDRSLEDSTFHDQVMLTRQELTQNPPSHVLSSELFESICKAESTFDQHIMDCKWKTDATKDRVFLLEIYAGKDSPLTEAVKRLGLPSCRFTREDGDLSTISGRAKLWHVIETCQPEHIWVAPECGPWSGWNRLNQQKSVALFDMIQQKQYDQLPHVQLCARLCKYQTDRNRHFHLEQPRGSGLLQLEFCIRYFNMFSWLELTCVDLDLKFLRPTVSFERAV